MESDAVTGVASGLSSPFHRARVCSVCMHGQVYTAVWAGCRVQVSERGAFSFLPDCIS